jgi:Bacterial PH domain
MSVQPFCEERMFKRIASEALGLSDIGIIVPPSDYTKVDADDYLFHEDGEKIFFLIKSKKDEYCFTNFALIHVDGESAVSAKRSIKRYEFSHHRVSGVSIETAGTVDRDVELKFSINELAFSIDVRKDFIEALKDIYKALIAIGHQQKRDQIARDNVQPCLAAVASAFKIGSAGGDDVLARQFHLLLNATNEGVRPTRDFSAFFEKYIHA